MRRIEKFIAQVEEKFPWSNMEQEVEADTFLWAFKDEYKELLWDRLDAVLMKYIKEDPLRCAEILDFVGRGANARPRGITLAHYCQKVMQELALKCYSEAVKQCLPFTTLQVLIVRDMIFESVRHAGSGLKEKAFEVWSKISFDDVYVKDHMRESEYVLNYAYLIKKKTPFWNKLSELKIR